MHPIGAVGRYNWIQYGFVSVIRNRCRAFVRAPDSPTPYLVRKFYPSGGISGKTGAQIQDAVPPTQMAFTLIPRSASSKATDLVNPTTPNLAAV
jgi:hypothetical protein